MIIIRCKAFIKNEQFDRLYRDLLMMAANGVILLPEPCELLNEVPPDEEIVIVKKKEV